MPKKISADLMKNIQGYIEKNLELEEALIYCCKAMALMPEMEESFSQALLKKIDEAQKTDVEVYKKAGIDRKLFSKVRKPDYHPSKKTAVALCLSLELSLSEAEGLLQKAGYALSKATIVDVIYRYCFEHKVYDLDEVNNILFSYKQPTLF